MRYVLVGLVACSAPTPRHDITHHAEPAPAAASPNRCVNGRYGAPGAVQSHAELGFADDRVEGDLDRNIIRRAIHDHNAELQSCYSGYLERGSMAGRVNARFTIVHDGSVGDAWVTGFDDALADCVCEVVATMQFLPTRGGAITVTYPFTFAPAP
jgi:hypothetical protein